MVSPTSTNAPTKKKEGRRPSSPSMVTSTPTTSSCTLNDSTEDCLFHATIENQHVRLLATLIRTIHLTQFVTLTVSSLGLKFSAQDTTVFQASVYLQKDHFKHFHYSPSLSSSTTLSTMALSSAEPSSSSEPSSHTPLSSFSITLDMNALLECVQLFSSTSTTHESTTQGHPSSSHPPPPPPPPSLHDPSTTTSNKSKFKSSVSNLTKTSVLQLLCQHPDGPLEFIFQDQGLRSHCKLTSYTSPSSPPHSPSSSSSSSSFPSTLPLLLSYSTHLPEYHHVILPSSFLEEALMLVLDQKRCPIQLKVNETGWQMFIAHPLSNDHPHSTPITSTHTNTILTSTHITVHQHAPMLERFQVHQPSAFTYTHLHSCVPGLSVSKKTSLRTNQRGFLNVQCMVVSPHTCFIDYIVAPLVGSV